MFQAFFEDEDRDDRKHDHRDTEEDQPLLASHRGHLRPRFHSGLSTRRIVGCGVMSGDVLYDQVSSLVDLVEAVRALPYGRPSDRTVEGMLRERRGTCSTKHLFLTQALQERFPETEPLIVHRVYTLDRARARELFGAAPAEIVPASGLIDVHRYLTITLDAQRVAVDATFPGPAWDGRSSLPLACGPGRDYPAGKDPDAEKRALEARHCDAAIREPFIAALASIEQLQP